MLGEWVQAMGCRLQAIEHNTRELMQNGLLHHTEVSDTVGREMESLFSLLLSLLQQNNNDKKAALILQVTPTL